MSTMELAVEEIERRGGVPATVVRLKFNRVRKVM
jgi:hypothetical protein